MIIFGLSAIYSTLHAAPPVAASGNGATQVVNAANGLATGANALANGLSSALQSFGGLVSKGKNIVENTADNVSGSSKLTEQATQEASILAGKLNNIANQMREWLRQDIEDQQKLITNTKQEIQKVSTALNKAQNDTARVFLYENLNRAQQNLQIQEARLVTLQTRSQQLEFSLQLNTEAQISQFLHSSSQYNKQSNQVHQSTNNNRMPVTRPPNSTSVQPAQTGQYKSNTAQQSNLLSGGWRRLA